MNLILARACTNNCPYCFEATEREKGRQNLISAENVIKVAEWARKSNLASMSFLGGEPFLHPELGNIVKLFRRACPGTNLRILTGGVFNKRLLDTISPQDTGLVFNVNEPRDYKNPKHFNKVINNIEQSIRKGFNVVLGFNVWRRDFDTRFMPELANRLGRSKFCWTVANPIKGHTSNVVGFDQYNVLADRCFEMLKNASSLKLETLSDCPLPYCFFNDAQLGWVTQYHPRTISNLGVCSPILDITPELEVIRCFALSGMQRVNLLDFRNELELRDWFIKNIDDRLLQGGCFTKCNHCIHFEKGRCYGGCLAGHEQNGGLDVKPLALQLIENLGQALSDNHPEAALEQFKCASSWVKTDIATFSAAVAASQLGQWRQVLIYATTADHMTSNRELKQKISELMAIIPATAFDSVIGDAVTVQPDFVACPDECCVGENASST